MENTIEKALLTDTEKERLARLYGYNIINNHEQSGTFKHVASMAARIFNVPMACVNFVDGKSVLIEASVGVNNLSEVDREISLCSLAILKDEVTVFENAKEELCLLLNPFVHSELGIQFYAAAPLKTLDGFNIGTVIIAGKEPRVFSKDDEQMLEGLAAIVMEELEERKALSSQ